MTKVMGEKTTTQAAKKLSYEELQKVASELHANYKKLMAEYRKAMEALSNREYEMSLNLIQMLFRVVEHSDKYDSDFAKFCAENVKGAIMSFMETMKPQEENSKSEDKPKTDEA